MWPSSVGGIDAEDGDGDGDGDAEDGQGESWDLSGYDGIEVEVGRGDGKVYTFILKDGEMGGKGEDGRGGAGVSWEVEVVVGGDEGGVGGKEDGGIGDDEKEGGGSKIWIPWGEFKATYRGKPKKDAGELKTGEIRQVGLMMRR